MPSFGTLGGILPLGPKNLKVKHPSGWFNRTEVAQPACLSQIIIMSWGWSQGYNWMWQCSFQNFLVDTGANYAVLTSYFRDSSSQTCTILGATGKSNYKWFIWALLCCWDGQIFPYQFLVVPGYCLIGKRSLPAFKLLKLLPSWQKML